MFSCFFLSLSLVMPKRLIPMTHDYMILSVCLQSCSSHCYCPLLVLKGTYHYWTRFICFPGRLSKWKTPIFGLPPFGDNPPLVESIKVATEVCAGGQGQRQLLHIAEHVRLRGDTGPHRPGCVRLHVRVRVCQV